MPKLFRVDNLQYIKVFSSSGSSEPVVHPTKKAMSSSSSSDGLGGQGGRVERYMHEDEMVKLCEEDRDRECSVECKS